MFDNLLLNLNLKSEYELLILIPFICDINYFFTYFAQLLSNNKLLLHIYIYLFMSSSNNKKNLKIFDDKLGYSWL